MQFDLWLPTATPFCTAELMSEIGRQAEDRGLTTLWVGEHVVLFDEYASKYPYAADGRLPVGGEAGLLEPFSALSFLAGVTSRLRLGTAMCLLPQRNPVYCAKEAATLDWLSEGRLDFGIGVGWLREEFEAVGAPFERRGARTDEYVSLLTTLWQEPEPSFEGRFYRLAPCRFEPKPRQRPHPPLHIGGESDAALARTARVGQGWHTFSRLPEDLPGPLGRLEELLEAEGRSRSEVRVTVCPYVHELTPERVEAYAQAGADAVAALFLAFSPSDVEAAFEALDPSIRRALEA